MCGLHSIQRNKQASEVLNRCFAGTSLNQQESIQPSGYPDNANTPRGGGASLVAGQHRAGQDRRADGTTGKAMNGS